MSAHAESVVASIKGTRVHVITVWWSTINTSTIDTHFLTITILTIEASSNIHVIHRVDTRAFDTVHRLTREGETV